MPHVSVKMWTGRTQQQKQELAKKIEKAIMDTSGTDEMYISIAIEDVEPSEWKKIYTDEIQPKKDVLFKKPGYNIDDL